MDWHRHWSVCWSTRNIMKSQRDWTQSKRNSGPWPTGFLQYPPTCHGFVETWRDKAMPILNWDSMESTLPQGVDPSRVKMVFRAHALACPECLAKSGTRVPFGTMPDAVSHPNCQCSVFDEGVRFTGGYRTRTGRNVRPYFKKIPTLINKLINKATPSVSRLVNGEALP